MTLTLIVNEDGHIRPVELFASDMAAANKMTQILEQEGFTADDIQAAYDEFLAVGRVSFRDDYWVFEWVEVKLGNAERAALLVREALWPEDDPDQPWSPDTLDDIADIMVNCGFGPKEEGGENEKEDGPA